MMVSSMVPKITVKKHSNPSFEMESFEVHQPIREFIEPKTPEAGKKRAPDCSPASNQNLKKLCILSSNLTTKGDISDDTPIFLDAMTSTPCLGGVESELGIPTKFVKEIIRVISGSTPHDMVAVARSEITSLNDDLRQVIQSHTNKFRLEEKLLREQLKVFPILMKVVEQEIQRVQVRLNHNLKQQKVLQEGVDKIVGVFESEYFISAPLFSFIESYTLESRLILFLIIETNSNSEIGTSTGSVGGINGVEDIDWMADMFSVRIFSNYRNLMN